MFELISQAVGEKLRYISADKERKQRPIPVSVPLSVELTATLDGIRDYIGVTREDIALYCIKESLENMLETFSYLQDSEYNVLDYDDYGNEEQKFFIINTGRAHNADMPEKIFSEKTVTFSGESWSEACAKIRKGDVIFFYENGRGLVAHAISNGSNGEILAFEAVSMLKEALHPDILNDIFRGRAPFFSPVLRIKKGPEILDYIKRHVDEGSTPPQTA